MMTPMDIDPDAMLAAETPVTDFYLRSMNAVSTEFQDEEKHASLSLTPDQFEAEVGKPTLSDRRSSCSTRGDREVAPQKSIPAAPRRLRSRLNNDRQPDTLRLR